MPQWACAWQYTGTLMSLERLLIMKKNLMAVPWKMGYYHDDERVVERGFLLGNCLEEEGQTLLDSVEVYWVWVDSMEKVFDHWIPTHLEEGRPQREHEVG